MVSSFLVVLQLKHHVDPVSATESGLTGTLVLKSELLVELDKLTVCEQSNPVSGLDIAHTLIEGFEQSRTKTLALQEWQDGQAVYSNGAAFFSVANAARRGTGSFPVFRNFHVLVHDSRIGGLGHDTVSKEYRLARRSSGVYMVSTGCRLNRCKRRRRVVHVDRSEETETEATTFREAILELFSGCTLFGWERGVLQLDSAVNVGSGQSLDVRLDLSKVILLLHITRDLVLGFILIASHHGGQIAGHVGTRHVVIRDENYKQGDRCEGKINPWRVIVSKIGRELAKKK